MARPKKTSTLTPKQRNDRHNAKLKRFGIKRLYFKASQSEQIMIDRLLSELNQSRDELVLTLLRTKAATHGIFLSDIQAELAYGSNNQEDDS
ncbi:TPA: hypothetical protein L3N15_004154 [Vibrio parahaemolyticus]|uniref:hypothetical protein n=1 Tax=Vibrio parahaemolyticus TaxID=670 RepID=UPI000C99A8E5|nr:hypothetical protein [Vibrio parahaemolyticus]PMS91912.1 hypothetical protein C1T06_22720 [Vibrio parahaemolyticus]HBN6266173.1 hypothetical protein [Vibrio parahaemolyticus]